MGRGVRLLAGEKKKPAIIFFFISFFFFHGRLRFCVSFFVNWQGGLVC